MRRSIDKYKWVIWATLALAFLIVFFHRYATAVVADDLTRDLGLSGSQLSLLASMYFYAYALMQIPSGILADYVGPRRSATAGMLLAALGALVFSMATQASWAYLGRLLVGIGVGVIFICTLKMQSTWFRASEFATISGLTSVIGNFGGILATTPLAILVVNFGWRPTFRYIALATLGVALLVWLLVRDRPEELGFIAPNPSSAQPHVPLGQALRNILANRHTWPNVIYFFCMSGSVTAFSGLWGIPYLTQTYGVDKQGASQVVLMMTLGVALGGPAMGWLSDRIGRIKPILLATSGLYTLIWFYILHVAVGRPPFALNYILYFVLGFISIGFLLCFNNVKQVNNPAVSGIASGVVNTAGFGGTAVLNSYVGHLLERVTPGPVYSVAAYRFAFSVFIFLSLLAFLVANLIKEQAQVAVVGRDSND